MESALAKQPKMSSNGAGAHCTYCERKLQPTGTQSPLTATRDHVKPKAYCWGENYKVWACYACNQIKADKEPDEWALFMKENPKWWEGYANYPGSYRGTAGLLKRGFTY